MESTVGTRATLDDLYRTEGKAELIGGRIVKYPAFGFLPGTVAGNLYLALNEYAERRKSGWAFGATLGYAIAELPSGRESFSPDASYYRGPLPENLMGFVEGPPTFAVEIRGADDFGPSAEVAMAAKRVDYFAAGTLAVWDVDPLAETVTAHRADGTVVVFRRGDTADAEPAVPGWRMAVDEVFER